MLKFIEIHKINLCQYLTYKFNKRVSTFIIFNFIIINIAYIIKKLNPPIGQNVLCLVRQVGNVEKSKKKFQEFQNFLSEKMCLVIFGAIFFKGSVHTWNKVGQIYLGCEKKLSIIIAFWSNVHKLLRY